MTDTVQAQKPAKKSEVILGELDAVMKAAEFSRTSAKALTNKLLGEHPETPRIEAQGYGSGLIARILGQLVDTRCLLGELQEELNNLHDAI